MSLLIGLAVAAVLYLIVVVIVVALAIGACGWKGRRCPWFGIGPG